MRFSQWGEERCLVEGGAPRAPLITRSRPPVWLHDLPEPCDPLLLLVPGVPEKPEPASRCEHSVNLAQGRPTVEPVKGLRRGDGVDGGVGKRNRLGCSFESANAGEARLE